MASRSNSPCVQDTIAETLKEFPSDKSDMEYKYSRKSKPWLEERNAVGWV